MFINSFCFIFNTNRWNNDDDDDDNDRKTDLEKGPEDNNRKRKSRWTGRQIKVFFYVRKKTEIVFIASAVKQEPVEHQFVQQIHEGLFYRLIEV